MEANVSVSVETGCFAVAKGLTKVVVTGYQAAKDGWQPGQDFPVLYKSAMEELPAVLASAKLVAGEIVEKPVRCGLSVVLGVVEGLGL
jgi:hypothetical protein